MTPDSLHAAAFRGLHLPATLIDVEGRIVDVNDAFFEFARGQGIDLRLEDRVGQPIWAFAGADHARLGREAILAFLAGRDPGPAQLLEADGHGRQALHELRLRRLRDADGCTVGALITREEVTEGVRQAQDLASALALVSAFRTVGHLVLSSLDADVIIETIAREVVKAGIFRSVTLAVVDEAQHSVEVERSFVRRIDSEGHVIPGSTLRAETDVIGLRYDLDDDNIMAETARRGQLMVTEGEDPRFDSRVKLPTERSARACFFIPVKKGQRVLAIIATASPPDQRDEILRRIEAMEPLLDQVAIALEHARHYRQTQAREQEARVRLAIQRVRAEILQMQTDADWRRVVTVLRRELRHLIDYSACGINLVTGDHITAYGAGPGVREALQLSRVPPALRKAIDTGRPIYRRTQQEMRAYGDGAGLLGGGVHAVIDVPFGTGTLAVNSTQPEAFDDADVEVLTQFAVVLNEGHRRLGDLQALAGKERQLQQAQKMEAIGQLTAGIAHNFNNMLQAITGNLELLSTGTDGAGAELIDNSLRTCTRAARMVHQLMVYSRQTIRTIFRPLDLILVVGDVEAMCRRTFDRRIDLQIAVDQDLPAVNGDATQLEQVLLNLCINARDALEEAGSADPRIRVEVGATQRTAEQVPGGAAPGRFVRLRVVDNGPGMDAATRVRIFEPFFTTKEVDRGTGLGLSTAFGMVQDHQGWIECDSQPGEGTRFDVYLPTIDASPIEPEPRAAMQEEHGHETILVIDDEDMVRNTAVQMLERRGFQVLGAADGESGLAIFQEHGDDIDLVLLDHSMPRMSGRETLQALRRLSASVGVIIITGFPTGLPEFEGADDLLRKPFSMADLIGHVRAILDRQR